jgi:hypothetical protein
MYALLAKKAHPGGQGVGLEDRQKQLSFPFIFKDPKLWLSKPYNDERQSNVDARTEPWF